VGKSVLMPLTLKLFAYKAQSGWRACLRVGALLAACQEDAMGRPLKRGIDAFLFDVVDSEALEAIEAKFGLKGFAIVVKLLQYIFQRGGYYCEWNERVASLFVKRALAGDGIVREIVNSSLDEGIFDKRMYARYKILTSEWIQERYALAVARRKGVELVDEYLLISAADFPVNATIIHVNAAQTGVNAYNNPTRELKRIEEKKIKESVGDAAAKPPARTHFEPPSIAEIEAYCKQRHNGIDARRFVDYYTANGWHVGKGKMRDWRASVRSWEHNGVNDNSQPASSGSRPAAATGYSENTYAPGELDAVYTDIMLEEDK
jgi:hypothetical protein